PRPAQFGHVEHHGPHDLRPRRRRLDAGAELGQALRRRVRIPHRKHEVPRAARSAARWQSNLREPVMLEIEIDGKQVQVNDGSTVMDAAAVAGAYIPHFCYHKKLSIAA